ncbi:MAG: TatD family hydrolase [Lachnospiraceae bacterium]|nr:TatD family hydrolase [Lachnospiraceae bacterium]
MRIFETHAHYDDDAFDDDRDSLLQQMHKKGIDYIVNIGCSMDNSRHIVKMIQQYDFLYGTVGVHPSDIQGLTNADMQELEELSKREKILAIGEIGLDYHYDNVVKENQAKWFLAQLEIAKRRNLPVVIHSRDAAKDTLDIMKEHHNGVTPGIIHCFSYGVEMAREYLNMGYHIGVGGVVTFKNAKKLKEVVEYTPLNRIVLETDAPYLAPTPYRGKRNCSLYLTHVAEEIAAIKNVSIEEVCAATYENAMKIYNVEKK